MPSNVTLAAPVRARFVTDTLLGVGAVKLKAADSLPTASPAVATTVGDREIPLGSLPRTELSEVHTVASPRLPPTVPHAL
jgi:hypothetical protein